MSITEIIWIALDWGTSNLRIWALDKENKVLAKKNSDLGMSKVSPEDFESVLVNLVDE